MPDSPRAADARPLGPASAADETAGKTPAAPRPADDPLTPGLPFAVLVAVYFGRAYLAGELTRSQARRFERVLRRHRITFDADVPPPGEGAEGTEQGGKGGAT